MPFRIAGTSPSYTVALCVAKAWAVRLACNRCDRPAALWCDVDLARLPAGATLGAIAARARCAGCGSAEGELSTRQGFWGVHAMHGRG
jgi:hypothetical protein